MSLKNISIKWVAIGFITYMLLTVIAAGVLTSVWMAGQDLAGLSQQQVSLMAETSPFIITWSVVIALLATLFVSMLVTKKSNRKDFANATGLAVCLTLYGILSIYLHPEHAILHQFGKLVGPITLCLLGAYLTNQWNKRGQNGIGGSVKLTKKGS
jgi:cation transport ATPase